MALLIFVCHAAFAQKAPTKVDDDASVETKDLPIRLGVQLLTWDRTFGEGISIGYRAVGNFSLQLGGGNYSYQTIDDYSSQTRGNIKIDEQWYDLFIRYDFRLNSFLGLGLMGGPELRQGNFKYTLNPYTTPVEFQSSFNSVIPVAELDFYYSNVESGKFPFELGLGLRLRALAESKYSYTDSSGNTQSAAVPPGESTTLVGYLDWLF